MILQRSYTGHTYGKACGPQSPGPTHTVVNNDADTAAGLLFDTPAIFPRAAIGIFWQQQHLFDSSGRCHVGGINSGVCQNNPQSMRNNDQLFDSAQHFR